MVKGLIVVLSEIVVDIDKMIKLVAMERLEVI